MADNPAVYKKLNKWSPSVLLGKLDMFGSDLPTFNLGGQEKITTYPGGVLSLLITVVMMSYAFMKFNHLIDKHNPNISLLNEVGIYDSSEVLTFEDINFRVAFSMVNYFSRATLDDPRYLKYIARLVGKENGIWYERMLETHKCTEEDWALFNPVSALSEDSMNSIWNNQDKRYMFCFDKDEVLQTWGSEGNEHY